MNCYCAHITPIVLVGQYYTTPMDEQKGLIKALSLIQDFKRDCVERVKHI
jgi:hypothetical protein